LDEYTAPPTRATEPNGEELLEWFENTFGHILNCPLPQPDRRWQPHSDNDGSAMTPAPSPSSRTTPLPSAQPAINQRWANPQVDKWWEGRWPHHVKVPIELQIRAENQAYQNDVRSRRNSDASEFGPSHPLSPNMGGPGRVPPARDPMAASLMSDYHRLNQSSRWQLTRSPRGLQRHLTA
jgi:hypothetical protein